MQPVSQSRLAEHAGVSGAAISYACRPGGPLFPAMVGRRVDAAHPAVLAYLKKHDAEPMAPDTTEAPAVAPVAKVPHVRGRAAAKEAAKAAVPVDAGRQHPVPANIEPFADMTLRQLIRQFGTDLRFGDWLKSAKVIEDIRAKQLQNAELRGDLIPRDFVRTHIVGLVEELFLRLINDAAPTISATAREHVKAKKPKEETDIVVGQIISGHLQRTKQEIAKNIRKAGKGQDNGR